MIDFWGRVTRTEKAEALRLLKKGRVRISGRARSWGVLSQGERQRVLIGRALMAKPRVLILDEPCAKALTRRRANSFLANCSSGLGKSRRAPTLVLVTHHVEEIMPVFSHILVLKGGKILAGGRKAATLNSRNLSQAFAVRMRMTTANRRYALKVAGVVNKMC